MNTFNWERFLRRWSQEILAAIADNQKSLSLDTIQSGWLGYPGATDDQITQVEKRLGIALPPSYRAFLKVSNGWQQTTPFIPRLWSTAEIEWFSVRHQDWINTFLYQHGSASAPIEPANCSSPPPSVPDTDYFVYGDEQDCSKIRLEYLQTALEISEKGDFAIYLLNPKAIAADGEWEAWFFGDWLPGADRYRSFCEMMQAEYENFLELRDTPPQHVGKPVAVDMAQPDEMTSDPQLLVEPVMPVAEKIINAPETPETPETLETPETPETPEWDALGSFKVEFQSRTVAGSTEHQTIASNLDADAVETWSGIELEKVQTWMINQLNTELLLEINEEALMENAPVTAEIIQLRVMPSRWIGKPLVVDKTHYLLPNAIKAGEPFILEVSLNLAGLNALRIAKQRLAYRTQCYARHLSTGAVTNLGDIVTNICGVGKPSYITLLPEMTLRQPGAYRLKVLVTPQHAFASSTSFKLPMLQVM